MKKLLPIIFIFLFASFLGAQTKQDTRDNVNAAKVAFISEKMKLTPAEAEKFWPVYNEYEQKKENIRKERIKARKKFEKDEKTLTEKETEALIDTEVDCYDKEAEVTKERHKQFKKIFTMKKIAMLYKAEEDFKKELIKKACDNLKNNKGGVD
jgi:hypothetical protein